MAAAQRKIVRCLPLLEEKCRASTLHSAKFVRLRMPTVQSLLKLMPSAKVVHLLRDPRGILISRHREARNRTSAMISDAQVLCATMVRDLRTSALIAKRYRNSLLTLKYEHVASDPLHVLDTIYKHLRLDTPASVKTWFNHTMRHGESKSGGSTTRKKNPQAIATKWQSIMDDAAKKAINSVCAEAIAMSGYEL